MMTPKDCILTTLRRETPEQVEEEVRVASKKVVPTV